MSEGDHRTLEQFTESDDGETDVAESRGDSDPGGGDASVAEAAAVADSDGHITSVVDPEDARYPAAEEYLEIGVTQVDYTVERSSDTEYPVIHVFGRTEEGVAEHIRVLGVEPYFYVPRTAVADRALTEEYDAIVAVREHDEDDEGFESIRGTPVVKVITRTPRDVGEIRDDFEETFEADVRFPNRFLVDQGVRAGLRVPARRLESGTVQVPAEEVSPADATADPRISTIDIEVDDRRGFPEDGEEPIVCLTTHDSVRDEYVAWHYTAPGGSADPPEGIEGGERIDAAASVAVRAFDEETAMLEAFLDYIAETNPDILTGWNFEEFDAPYLLDRMEEVGVNPERLSRVEEIWRSGWGGPNIKGRVVFDLLRGYRSMVRTELDSYRLDDVGEAELGVGKERYPGDIGDLWETDPERLLGYNVRDVEICVELDRHQEIIPFYQEVADFVGCKLEDAPTAGDTVDMYVLHKAHGEFTLPSKGMVEEGEEFEGGAVFEPITGVKEMVSVLDLKSLYPMAMRTINASPETKVDESFDGPVYEAPNGTRFRKQPDGIMREMITELLEEREEKKRRRDEHEPESDPYDLYDRQQAAVKVIMNCFTADTEVLTPDGVRDIRELAEGDRVYSVDPETNTLEVKPIVATHAYPKYSGPLIDIQAEGTDLRVTPNHRLLTETEADEATPAYQFIQAGELSEGTTYSLPHGWAWKDDGPGCLPEEGTSIRSDGGVATATEMPLTDIERADGLPERVFRASRAEQRAVLSAFSTGGVGVGEWSYVAQTVAMRDDLLRLWAVFGYPATYTGTSEGWRVEPVGPAATDITGGEDTSVERATDGVYCVTVADNHTLLAGRNGTFQAVGQSLYGVSGWTRFRLYDKDAAAAVTATGREVIEFTEEVANRLDYDVTYGDSVTGDRPIVVRDPSDRIRIEPIADIFDAGAPRQDGAVQVTADGGAVSTVTRGKDRRTLPGWEALSITDDGEPTWKPIRQAIRHETEKPIVRLRHPAGESTTTKDHAYVVERNGDHVEAPPSEVQSPLRVPDLPTDRQIETVTVGAAGATEPSQSVSLGTPGGRALFALLGATVAGGEVRTGDSDDPGAVSIQALTAEGARRIEQWYRTALGAGTVSIETATGAEASPRVTVARTDPEGPDHVVHLRDPRFAKDCLERLGLPQRPRVPNAVFQAPATEQAAFLAGLRRGGGAAVSDGDEADTRLAQPITTTQQPLAAGLAMLSRCGDGEVSLAYEDEAYRLEPSRESTGAGTPTVTPVEHDGAVYDLDVAGTDAFVDALGGIVLHNTDSVMLELGGDVDVEEAIDQSFALEERINESYAEFAAQLGAEEHFFEIEFEKLYRRFFQAGKKKRYAGHIVWKEGNEVDDVDITGFEYKRSDIAPITKEVQQAVIERIVHGEDLAEIKSYLHDVIQDFRAGEVDVEAVGIPGGIGKRLDNYDTDTAHVRGAKYANLVLGTNFSRGSKPKRVYLEKVHPDFFERFEQEAPEKAQDPIYEAFRRNPDVICIEYADQLPEEFVVDWDKMLDKTLKGPIERILEALDVSWEEVKAGQTQTGLSNFM
ncbi:MAG: DNA polymerase domain-containing protein [Halodesulfurarchaeum sp.]